MEFDVKLIEAYKKIYNLEGGIAKNSLIVNKILDKHKIDVIDFIVLDRYVNKFGIDVLEEVKSGK